MVIFIGMYLSAAYSLHNVFDILVNVVDQLHFFHECCVQKVKICNYQSLLVYSTKT